MSNSNFLHKENVSMLWDVISDEELFKFLSKTNQADVSQVFSNNIRGFFESEKVKNSNLVDINKKYIMLILNYIKENLNQKMPSKIKILEEPPVRELITYEDLQTDRLSQFDKDLNKRQEEFTSAMALNVPEAPKFTDNYKDKPITGIDKILKEMTAKRNYEVEQINRNYSSDIEQTSNWLKPQDTSVKAEKFLPKISTNDHHQPLRLHTDINVSADPKKTVSWDNLSEIIDSDVDDEMEVNLFKKLKRVSNREPEKATNITLTLEETPMPDDRLTNLETQMRSVNDKMDMILQILQERK